MRAEWTDVVRAKHVIGVSALYQVSNDGGLLQ